MMDKVAVLFVHSATLPPLGADTWVQALIIRSLDPERFERHVACAATRCDGGRKVSTPTFDAISGASGVRIHPIDFGPELFGRSGLARLRAARDTLPLLWHVAALARLVRARGIRVIHTTDRPRDAVASVLLARMTGARCIVHVHVAYGDWFGPARRWAMQRADALVGVSRFVSRTMTDAGYDPAKVHTILNAVDLAAWDPTSEGPEVGLAVRREHGIPADAPLVTVVARVMREKGHVELLRAIAKVAPDVPAVRLMIVGEEYPRGNGHEAELRALAAELGIAERVVFTGRRGDVARVLAASDVFAMPSFEEPFGLVYVEAMAMKKPVVAFASGGAPEVVADGTTGLLAPAGDVERLAEHLRTLLLDPSLRARMGEAGRARAEAHFAAQRQAQDVTRLYEALAATRSRD